MTAAEVTPRSSVRALLAHGGYWRWSAATQAYRLPSMMAPLAFVLAATRERHSTALGGIMVTVWTLAPAAVAPLGGRLYDRIGVAKWAPRVLTFVAAGLVGMGLCLRFGVPSVALVVVTGVVAVSSCGLGGCTRTLLTECVPDHLLPSALSLDSSVIELTIIGAPLIVAATAVVGPVWPVYAMGAAALASALLLRRPGGHRAPEAAVAAERAPAGRSGQLWRNPSFLFWLLVAAAFGQSLGTLEIGALPVATELHGASGRAAMLMAILGAASGLSGVGYAMVADKIRLPSVARAAGLLAVMAGAGVLLGLTHTLWAVVALYVAIGLCTAPLNTVVSWSVQKDVDASRRTEAFASIGTTNAIGYAIPGVMLAAVSLPVMLSSGCALAAAGFLIGAARSGGGREPASATEPAPADPTSVDPSPAAS